MEDWQPWNSWDGNIDDEDDEDDDAGDANEDEGTNWWYNKDDEDTDGFANRMPRTRNEVDYSSPPPCQDPFNIYFARDPNWIWCPSTRSWSRTARKNYKPPHQ